ncbi:MAG: preprotein translocase subunit YajC [Bacteroidales bacterium]|nr:preprotein translocase subunit YajC [Bacteroidales bacterium]
MNTIATLLLQAAPAAPANASAPGGQGAFWIMIIAMFAIMWLFMIRPQRKQQKELEAFRNALQKGDKVITAGGIYGTVDEVKDRYVVLKVDGETKLRVDKSSIVKDPGQNQA